MLRVIDQAKPAWLLAENVTGLISMELDNVLSSLEGIGYACGTLVIPACAVDARHRRDRVWIIGRKLADTNQRGLRCSSRDERHLAQCGEGVANTEKFTERKPANETDAIAVSGRTRPESGGGSRWLPEPDLGRVAHGIPSRVDRLKGLGNAIVPQVAFEILREIRKLI
jgi:DNA (cytosine-5)-methyltransferase 1